MSHFALLWKARTIEKYRQNYENEKINSIIKSNAEIPDKTLFQKWRHYSHNLQNRLSRTFSKWYPEGTTVSNFYVSLRSDNMRLPNILLRSLYGFVGGLLLTYLGFMFFVFQLSLSVIHATVLSSILGILLTLGLTFSNRMRCLIFLLIPQLFSRVGRYTLTCYALVLILTGPATNTLKNSEVLSESMACSQEQIKTNTRQINESIQKPFNSIHETMKITIHKMKLVVAKLKAAVIRINRFLLSIASVTQSSFSWLKSVAKNCNNVLGKPEDTCMNAIKDGITTYNTLKSKGGKMNKEENEIKVKIRNVRTFKTDKMYKEVNENKVTNIKNERSFKTLHQDYNKCPKVNVAEDVCSTLNKYDKYCVPAGFVERSFLAMIKRKLKYFTNGLRRLFHVKINIHHSYVFIGTSDSTNQIASGIVTEIRNRADPILTWLSWSSCVTSLFLLLIIFRAKHYQHMFVTRSRFDNRFITKEFRELDLKRLRERRETVLPLNRRERAKYVTTTSFRLVASEKIHLNRSAIFMTITTFKLLIHIVADYSLYWVLMTIRHHGKLQAPSDASPSESGPLITGKGFVARLLQSFIDSLNVHLSFPPPDNTCLPNPYPPDFKRYCQIGFLIFLLWFFAIFEPYGLRIRHIIMGHYRPERAKTRAVWLYNHILRTRASFMKFARRRLHREYKYTSHSHLTLRKWLESIIPCAWLRTLLGLKRENPHCLLCHITERDSGNTDLIKCQVPKCPGAYCKSCFSDIGELCTICLNPSDYGDLSDISLERDSSSDSDSNEEDNFNDDHPGGHRRGNLTYRTNTFDDSTSKGSKFGKEMRLLNMLEKKRGKGKDAQPLLQKRHANMGAPIIENAIEIVLTKDNDPINFKELELEDNSITKKDCHENYNITKDENNNDVMLLRQGTFSFLQNNAFKVEPTQKLFVMRTSQNVTLLAKYLRKKGIIRCRKQKMLKKRKKKNTKLNRNRNKTKQKNISKIKQSERQDVKFFMTCSSARNDAEKGVQINKTENEENNINDKKQAVDDPPDKNNLEDKNENKTSKEKIKSSNSITCVCIQKFQSILTRYWKTQSSSKLNAESKQNLPLLHEKKHKRKKKKDSKDSSENRFKQLKDLKRSSRLFAYLDDWDWMQSHFTNHKQTNVKNRNRISKSTDADKKGKGDNPPKYADAEIVNNIRIPHLDLKQITGSGNDEDSSLKVETTVTESVSKENNNYASGALERFFHSINIKGLNSKRHIHVSRSNVKQKSKIITVDVNSSETKNNGCILKRYLSRSSGFSLSRPLSLLRNIYSSLLLRLNYMEPDVIEDDVVVKNALRTDEKEISVHPEMCSCACQYDLISDKDKIKTASSDCSTQTNLIPVEKKPILVDARTGSEQPLCTCATQYQRIKANVGSSKFRRNSDSDIAILNRTSSISSESYQSESTETTVCNYCVKCRPKCYKYTQSPSITKKQQSTTTSKVNCDVSTATDWWSPITDKKDLKKYEIDRKENKHDTDRKERKYELDKSETGRKENKHETDRKEKRHESDKKEKNRYETHRRLKYTHFKKQDVEMVRNETMKAAVSSARRIVTFNSNDQIIPRDTRFDDLLSPSRYLLESQWYYNELFCSSFNRTSISTQKRPPIPDRRYVGHHQTRTNRCRKTKRLEEIYTCATRKHCSPRKRGNDVLDSPNKSKRYR